MPRDCSELSAVALAREIRSGERSPVAVVEASLDRIAARNDALNAFVTVLADEAREKAREAERAVERGDDLGPLHGVPVAIKDNFNFKAGVRNTLGSKPFSDFVPDETTSYVRALEDAGAIVVGKTNTPEFGHKGITDNRVVGPTSTPFDLGRNAGGSSGGSAAAVADGMVPIAQGTDGGGSVRIPAAWCSAYGFKAHYGRVAQPGGADAFLSHTPFTHCGPITRTVEDAALMMDVMAGPHSGDPMSLPDDGTTYIEAVDGGIDGFEIAYSPDFGVFPVDDRVRTVVDEAVTAFEEAGATVERHDPAIEAHHLDLADMWLRQMGVLYNSIVEGFKDDGIDLLGDHYDDLTPEFARLLEETRDMSVVEYKRYDHVRTDVYNAVRAVFDEYDLFVTPTLAVPPVENAAPGEGSTIGPESIGGEPVEPLIGWCLTYPLNYTGHPAASVPAGFTDDEGLPVGMQIVGDRFAESDVLAASQAFERLRPWEHAYPYRS